MANEMSLKEKQIKALNELKIVQSLVTEDNAYWLVEETEDLKQLILSTGYIYEAYLNFFKNDRTKLIDIYYLATELIKCDLFENGQFVFYDNDQLSKKYRELLNENKALRKEIQKHEKIYNQLRLSVKMVHQTIQDIDTA